MDACAKYYMWHKKGTLFGLGGVFVVLYIHIMWLCTFWLEHNSVMLREAWSCLYIINTKTFDVESRQSFLTERAEMVAYTKCDTPLQFNSFTPSFQFPMGLVCCKQLEKQSVLVLDCSELMAWIE